MSDLPKFQKRVYQGVHNYIARVLNRGEEPEDTSLQELTAYEDGHYRAIFRQDFFVLQDGESEATKSQWNTLKKRMKRIDKRVFIFKAYGECPCGDTVCLYIDFGFLYSN
jgi:hypothetical protein